MTTAATADRSNRSKFGDLLVAVGLSMGAVVSLGFSRFAYALLLPPMRDSLHWTYVQAGSLNTANALGYVIGSATAAWFSKRLGIKSAFVLSLLLSALVLLACGFTDAYKLLMAVRLVGGLATAVTFIVGASLAASINATNSPQHSSLLVATYITGVGSGIVASGVVIPPILASLGTAGWPTGWIWMGVIALITVIPATIATRAVPPQTARDAHLLPWKDCVFLWPTFANYSLYGAGYVSYMTFIILLIRQNAGGPQYAAVFWIVLGLSSVIGTLVWGRLLPKLGVRRGSPAAALVVMIGTLPVLISPTLGAAFVSAVLFGGSLMSGPTAVTVIVRKLVHAQAWTAALAALTVAFAVGQAIGPVLSGYVSDLTGSVTAGLWLSPALLIASAFTALFQRSR